MESALEIWQRRGKEPWLDGMEPRALLMRACTQWTESSPYVVAASEPRDFAVTLLAALTVPGPVDIFLGDVAPAWSKPVETRIMIATGGTTGASRYAMHTWATLAAAAQGLQTWLGGGPINSVCFLPLRHVSGLMQFVRSFVSGGELTLADWRAIESGRFPPVKENAVTSLVPTQLARLFAVEGATDWLRRFRAVFLGGAPAWPALLERARSERLPLAPCYGLTETAAQVMALRPEEFLAGRDGVGCRLPHAAIDVVDPSSGAAVPHGVEGRIRIGGASMFRGYYPDETRTVPFLTNDRGVQSADGYLTVLGRSDAVIITGGEKVDPAELEAEIRATGFVADVVVVGVPHPEWGEAVVAVVSASDDSVKPALVNVLRGRLPAYKLPKYWIVLAALPRSEAGKIDRRALDAIVSHVVYPG